MNIQDTTNQFTHADRLSGLSGSFFPARIMNPSEVHGATSGYAPVVNQWVKGKWYLCGDVQSAFFAVMKAEIRDPVSVRLTAFNSPAGGSYAVISHQLFGWAHRMVLPLYAHEVGKFLLATQQEELGFMFGNNGATDAVLLHSPLKGPAFAPLLAMANPLSSATIHDVISELPTVICALKMPQQVPSLRRDETVTDVSVSVVLPTDALVRFFSEKQPA